MAAGNVPWNQTPYYVAATTTTISLGGATSYAVPRRTGNGPQDVTDFHPGQQNWSREHLPDILYMFEPPRAWRVFQSSGLPPKKRDANGNIMYEKWPTDPADPRPLLDFPILPDRIGTFEEWWWFEAIRRIDPRVHWMDIEMRMEATNRPKVITIQNHTTRNWRRRFTLLSWYNAHSTVKRNEVLAKLTAAQVAANSTRGTTPGLINPVLGEAGGRIPYPLMKEGEGEARSVPQPHNTVSNTAPAGSASLGGSMSAVGSAATAADAALEDVGSELNNPIRDEFEGSSVGTIQGHSRRPHTQSEGEDEAAFEELDAQAYPPANSGELSTNVVTTFWDHEQSIGFRPEMYHHVTSSDENAIAGMFGEPIGPYFVQRRPT